MTVKVLRLILILALFFSAAARHLNAGENDDLRQRIDAKKYVTTALAVLFGTDESKFSSINEWEGVFKLGRPRADIEKQIFAAICDRRNRATIDVSLDSDVISVRVSNSSKIGEADVETSARLHLFFDSRGLLQKIAPSSSQIIRG